jgi:serine phosphatase RsbU (regulator of sigma subunit)/pSer/pThr/pTyr-binding forkhead associated (FHA) protein
VLLLPVSREVYAAGESRMNGLPTLLVKDGPLAGRKFPLAGQLDIGRSSRCEIPIDDRTISRRHATVTARPEAVVITDLDSQNGTAVNRRRITEPTRLFDGDEVRVGAITLVYSDEKSRKEPRSSGVRFVDSAPQVLASLNVADAESSFVHANETLTPALMRQRLDILHDMAVVFHQTLDEDALLSRVLEKVLAAVPEADRGFVVLAEGETLRTAAVKLRSGRAEEDVPLSKTLIEDVVKSRRGIISADAQTDPRLMKAESITSLDVRGVCCVPMIADGEVMGVVALDTARAGAFGKDELSILASVAALAALALSKARLHQRLMAAEIMERDLELAERIQSRFLPHERPSVPGWEFASHYRAALEVGGDYYDFVALPAGHLAVGIGDVSGKGISAALCMVRVAGEVRYRSAGRLEPAETLRDVNRSLVHEFEAGMFVTCLLMIVDPETGDVTVASAGHMPPLVRRVDGSIVELGVAKAPPIGVVEAAVFKSRRHRLETGDVAVLYTDGITEAHGPGGALFGKDRLLAAIAGAAPTPAGVQSAILDAVSEFTAGEPASDDVTLVCLGPVGGRASSLSATSLSKP